MEGMKIITFLILILILSCNTKTDESPPSPDSSEFGAASWCKNDDFYQAVILEKQKKGGKFHLDGYGSFNNYTSILARKIVFEKKKKTLWFEDGFVFPNNLPDESYLEDASILKTRFRKGEMLFSGATCLNKTIILHEEKTDIITVYVCRIYNKKKTVYKKIFGGPSFSISTWGWYKRVFGSKDNEMAVEK